MSGPRDGGSAFPVPEVRDSDGCGIMEGSRGMSLRDWFAGQALAGLIAQEDIAHVTAAQHAFAHADAMLAERAKGGGA